MRILIASAACLALAACATAEPAPFARPMTKANIDTVGGTPVNLSGNITGVAKSWYYTEVNGGGAGLAGAIGGAIASIIINFGPSRRANKQANEIAEYQTAEDLNESLLAALKAEAGKAPTGMHAERVGLGYRFDGSVLDDTLEISTSYVLSEDSSVIKIVAVASYSNKAVPYQTPYTFQKATPKSETTGPLYRNSFTYYSTPLPVPTLTPELKVRLEANVRESFEENGVPPAEKSDDYKAMMREIEDAKDDKLTPHELSLFLAREWVSKDGAKIKEEVARAHAFFAKYILADLNRTDVPRMDGEDELVETAADDRTVRRIGKGADAGSYVSSAANVSNYATYGNTAAIAKANAEYVRSMREKTKRDGKS